MKYQSTYTILFFVFIATSQLIGQQPLFAPLGAKWYYKIVPCDPNNPEVYYQVREVVVDSIIQGKNCTLVNSDNCPLIPSCVKNNFVYQDGEKVFIYDPLIESFQLLYDFSLQAGESYILEVCDSTWGTNSITATIEFNTGGQNGEQKIAIHPNQATWWEDYSVFIRKGIGNIATNPMLLSEKCIHFFDPCFITYLVCYETPETGVVNIIDNESCVSSTRPEVTKGSQKTYELYPNPAYGSFNIRSIRNFKNDTQFILSSMTGQVISKYQLLAFQNQFNCQVEDLSTGIYFWHILQAGNLIESGKIIIR